MNTFKIGDKVRLIYRGERYEYWGLTRGMLKQPSILTIRDITPSRDDRGIRINMNENDYNYHPNWLELVEEESKVGKIFKVIDNSGHTFKIGDEVACVEDDGTNMMKYANKSGYTNWVYGDCLVEIVNTVPKYPNIIKGVFFGNAKEYEWTCEDDMFQEINIDDIILVDTIRGEQVVKVVEKVINNKPNEATKEVIAIIELVD